MTPEEIIVADYARNHQGRSYSVQQAHSIFQRYVAKGEPYIVFDKVMFLLKPIGDQAVEFHTINGGTHLDLVDAVNQLLRKLSQHFSKAVTYYDNPAINDLLSHAHYPHVVRRVDQGIDHTYELSFNLRGA